MSMGHHIDSEGRFQSDKYPNLPPDKIVLSFKDPAARRALEELAVAYECVDLDLAEDVQARLDSLEDTPVAVTALQVWRAVPRAATTNEAFLDGWNAGVAHAMRGINE